MVAPNFKILKVFRLGTAFVNQQLKDVELSSGLVYIIVELSQAESMNMSDLSAAVGVNNAHVTRSVEKLSALGYVNKVQDEWDRRAFRVSLTPAGRQVAGRVTATVLQWVAIVTEGVPSEDIATVNRVFDRFYENALRRME